MTDFLLFTLYAPIASWGEIAVGESRGSWDRPSRSAILGLLAAALGFRREDQEEHDAIDTAYGVAIRLDVVGHPLVDYHTAQTVPASAVKKHRPSTRRDLLDAVRPNDRKTILSRRTYRRDALATAAVWMRGEAYRSLEEVADALRRPKFVLYAGRKSNPFGAPLAPQVVSTATLAEAFAMRSPAPTGLSAAALRPREGWGREVSHDPCDAFASGLVRLRRETRRDAHAHRRRWQFQERIVEVGLMPDAGSVASNGGT